MEQLVVVQADTQLDAVGFNRVLELEGDTGVYYAGAATGNADDQIIYPPGCDWTHHHYRRCNHHSRLTKLSPLSRGDKPRKKARRGPFLFLAGVMGDLRFDLFRSAIL